MEKTYNDLGNPGIFRNDRFWLAGDHVVDPRVNNLPKVRGLIDASERAKRVFKMTDYQGMNVGHLCFHNFIAGANSYTVHYSSHRILPGTGTTGHGCHRFRLPYVLLGSARMPCYWSWCCRCHFASGHRGDMVQGTGVCQHSSGWNSTAWNRGQGCHSLHSAAIKKKYRGFGENSGIYRSRDQTPISRCEVCHLKYDDCGCS